MRKKIHDLIHRIAAKFGIRISRSRPERSEHAKIIAAAKATQASCIVDIGANTGAFTEKLFKYGWDGTVVSFEPLPQEHADLSKTAAGYPSKWTVAKRCALGDASDKLWLEVAGNSVSSSLLPMNEAHIQAAPGSAPVGKIEVPVRRIDECDEIPSTGGLFLKVDTQGYEINVMKGATGILNRVSSILLEVSMEPLYGGQPLMYEVISFMDDLGYMPYDVIPGFHHHSSGRMLQANIIFVRKAVG